jgi:hypothetical protein
VSIAVGEALDQRWRCVIGQGRQCAQAPYRCDTHVKARIARHLDERIAAEVRCRNYADQARGWIRDKAGGRGLATERRPDRLLDPRARVSCASQEHVERCGRQHREILEQPRGVLAASNTGHIVERPGSSPGIVPADERSLQLGNDERFRPRADPPECVVCVLGDCFEIRVEGVVTSNVVDVGIGERCRDYLECGNGI